MVKTKVEVSIILVGPTVMIKYIRTYFNGKEVVVEFENEFLFLSHTPTGANRRFFMNEKNLLIRIKNGEDSGVKVNVEKKALKFLRAHDNYEPPKK